MRRVSLSDTFQAVAFTAVGELMARGSPKKMSRIFPFAPIFAVFTAAQIMKEDIPNIADEELKENFLDNMLIIEEGSKKAKEIISKLLKYTENKRGNFKKSSLKVTTFDFFCEKDNIFSLKSII